MDETQDERRRTDALELAVRLVGPLQSITVGVMASIENLSDDFERYIRTGRMSG